MRTMSLETYVDKMKDMKKDLYGQVHWNIERARKTMKENYDQKHLQSAVSVMLLT